MKRHAWIGYTPPLTATTDWCCQERSFWKSAFGFGDAIIDTQYLADEEMCEVGVVASPSKGHVASTIGVCEIFVGVSKSNK